MDAVETQALSEAMDSFFRSYDRGHRFSESDLRDMHAVWLADIYEWAGAYRQVNVSKGDFPFAAAARIPELMHDFSSGVLAEHTPCTFATRARVISALAVTHTEFVLIHPFREGNGRLARALSTLMALQAGLPVLDFGSLRGKRLVQYFAAVQAGLDRDYGPMEEVFGVILAKSEATS